MVSDRDVVGIAGATAADPRCDRRSGRRGGRAGTAHLRRDDPRDRAARLHARVSLVAGLARMITVAGRGGAAGGPGLCAGRNGRVMAAMVNALTFDIEEYFHAEAFAGVVRPRGVADAREPGGARRPSGSWSSWPRREGLGARSSSWAGSRSVTRSWCGRSHAQGHEVACHGYGHQMITRLSRRGVRRGRPSGPRRRSRTRPGSRWSATGRRRSRWCGRRSGASRCWPRPGSATTRASFPIVHDRYGIPDAPRFPHRLAAGSAAA